MCWNILCLYDCAQVGQGAGMITLYSGTPGSGKSLHVARIIFNRLRYTKQSVITNMHINTDYISRGFFNRRKIGNIIQLNNTEITPSYLIEYAKVNHQRGREGQTLIVIDECQMLFSPSVIKLRTQEDKEHRVKWLDLFSQHRHLGYDIILITQFDRLIDAQVRCMVEYNVIHRCVNRFGVASMLGLLGIKLFVAVEIWYGIKHKCGQEFFLYRKKYSKVYDSFSRFGIDDIADAVNTSERTADNLVVEDKSEDAVGACVLTDSGNTMDSGAAPV